MVRRKEVREVRGDESPVSQEIVKERDRIIIRFGNSTLTLTAGGIAGEVIRSANDMHTSDNPTRS